MSVLPHPAALTATHAHDRNWRQWPADRVNEQGTWPRFGRERSIKHLDVVGERLFGKMWIAQFYGYFFGNCIPILQEGHNRVRGVLSKAVLAITPLIDKLSGMQVAHNSLGTIRKEEGRVCRSLKRHGPVTTRHPLGTLHKHGLDVLDIRLGMFAYSIRSFRIYICSTPVKKEQIGVFSHVGKLLQAHSYQLSMHTGAKRLAVLR